MPADTYLLVLEDLVFLSRHLVHLILAGLVIQGVQQVLELQYLQEVLADHSHHQHLELLQEKTSRSVIDIRILLLVNTL